MKQNKLVRRAALCFAALLLVAASTATSAKAENYSYTFSAKQWDANGSKDLGGVSWTLDNNGGFYGYEATKGQQIGSAKASASNASISTSDISDTVTSVKVSTSGASGVNATVSVSVGGTNFGTAKSITATNTEYEFTGSGSGEIIIIWTNSSAKALYIKALNITCGGGGEDPGDDQGEDPDDGQGDDPNDDPAENGVFKKITSLTDLTDGNYIIAYGTETAMSNSNDDDWFVSESITVAGGTTITNPSANLVWKIETNGDYKTIYNASAKIYAAYTGGKNNAHAIATATQEANWEIDFSQGLFKIYTASTSSTQDRWLQYNESAPRFACYTGTQKDITLYKEEAGEPKPAEPVATAVGGITGSYSVNSDELASLSENITFKLSNITKDLNLSVVPSSKSASIITTPSGAIANPNGFTISTDTTVTVNVSLGSSSELAADNYQDTIIFKQESLVIGKAVVNISVKNPNSPEISITYPTNNLEITADSVVTEYNLKNITVAGKVVARLEGENVSVSDSVAISGGEGSAQITLGNLTSGTYTLEASVTGDAIYQGVETSVSFKVNLPDVATPVIPAADEYNDSLEVSITCATTDAAIYYTLDGTTPTKLSNPYTDKFVIRETSTLKAIAIKAGMDNSPVASAEYTINKIAKPVGDLPLNADVIFSEAFDKVNEGDACEAGAGVADLNESTLVSGWTGENVFQADGSVKLGTSSKLGWIQTPEIDLDIASTHRVYVRFDARAWANAKEQTSLKLYVNGIVLEGEVGPLNNTECEMDLFEFEIPADELKSSTTIKWEGDTASGGRFFLDNIVVYSVPAVAAPGIYVDCGEIVTITANTQDITAFVDIVIKGELLDDHVTAALSGEHIDHFDLDKEQHHIDDVMGAGSTLRVSYSGSVHNANALITLTSGSVVKTITLKGLIDAGPSVNVEDLSGTVKSLAVYPNPASASGFNVKVATPSVVTIFNAAGAKVGSLNVGSESVIKSLGSGLYFLRAIDGNGKVSTERVIVK